MAKTRENVRRLMTILQFKAEHPWATEGGLRWQRYNCESNGFQKAFISIGSKLLIDESEYFRCVDRQNGLDRSSSDERAA